METKELSKKIGQKVYFTNNTITSKIKKIISTSNYTTNGENLLIVKDVDLCNIILNSDNTDHITVKALSKTTIKHTNLIDDLYEEITMDNGSSVELCEVEGNFYIISSDGMKY
jgi:hypothetical protein